MGCSNDLTEAWEKVMRSKVWTGSFFQRFIRHNQWSKWSEWEFLHSNASTCTCVSSSHLLFNTFFLMLIWLMSSLTLNNFNHSICFQSSSLSSCIIIIPSELNLMHLKDATYTPTNDGIHSVAYLRFQKGGPNFRRQLVLTQRGVKLSFPNFFL